MANETNSPLTLLMEEELAADEVFISVCDEKTDAWINDLDRVWELTKNFKQDEL